MFTAATIASRIDELSQEINKHYWHTLQTSEITAVIVLRGGFIFGADLVRKLSMSVDVEFLRPNHLEELDPRAVQNKHILVIDDIYDTGNTCEKIRKDLIHCAQPDSIQFCCLLSKHLNDPRFTGFIVNEKAFYYGYGMDCRDGGNRSNPGIRWTD